MNIQKQLSNLLNDAYKASDLHPTLSINEQFFNVSYMGSHGIDYRFGGFIMLSKMLNQKEIKVSVEELGNYFIAKLRSENFKISIVRNYINFNVQNCLLENMINQILQSEKVIQATEVKKRIIIDFSSPNIAKDMHVGHLRSTIIGDTICRLLEAQDHDVSRINHIGDFGLQFGMLIQHMYDTEVSLESNITVSELQTFYAQSKKRFDADAKFKEQSYQRAVELQHGNEKVVKAWEFIKEVSRKAYSAIYKRLNINLDEVGESFYQPMIPSLIEELNEKGLLEDNEGRKIVRVPKIKEPLTVVKSNGGYTYDTTDLVALRYRLIDMKSDAIYYVIDSGQSLHFKLLFEVARLAGWLKDQDVKHIKFGLVLREDGKKFKSRDGNTVKLVDLLDQSVIKCQNILDERKSDLTIEEKNKVVKNLAYGAVKYADLSGTRTNNYYFSYDKMLSLTGNTALYLLYSYVRIAGIIRNAETFKVCVSEFKISSEYETILCKHILRFPEIIEIINEDMMFHKLCKYMFDLSKVFSRFFTNCRCLAYSEEKIIGVNYSRL